MRFYSQNFKYVQEFSPAFYILFPTALSSFCGNNIVISWIFFAGYTIFCTGDVLDGGILTDYTSTTTDLELKLADEISLILINK